LSSKWFEGWERERKYLPTKALKSGRKGKVAHEPRRPTQPELILVSVA